MSNRALKETAENCIIKTFGGKVCASEVWLEKIGLFHARFCERVRLHIEILFLNFLMGNRGKAAFWKIVPFYPPLSKSISSRVQCLVHKCTSQTLFYFNLKAIPRTSNICRFVLESHDAAHFSWHADLQDRRSEWELPVSEHVSPKRSF